MILYRHKGTQKVKGADDNEKVQSKRDNENSMEKFQKRNGDFFQNV